MIENEDQNGRLKTTVSGIPFTAVCTNEGK